MNKKGSVVLVIVIIVLAIVILGMFLVDVAQRDCSSNRECPQNAYCGADYECHEFPNQVVVKESNLFPALILGVSLVVAAYIFRRKRIS